jgi:hypothetical protein
MSQTAQNRTPKKREAFEPIDSYERLIVLRKREPDTFLLRTSEATRRTLHWYEAAKAKPERQT